ncbi:hypothetical protein MMC09_001362 [Bachmanniomyces sp. S44760]|nr:hypothetical protein [Bachmanniomyces sp. S44760]
MVKEINEVKHTSPKSTHHSGGTLAPSLKKEVWKAKYTWAKDAEEKDQKVLAKEDSSYKEDSDSYDEDSDDAAVVNDGLEDEIFKDKDIVESLLDDSNAAADQASAESDFVWNNGTKANKAKDPKVQRSKSSKIERSRGPNSIPHVDGPVERDSESDANSIAIHLPKELHVNGTQQGPAYSKPDAYLTAAFVENRLDEKSVDKAIAVMQAYKHSLVITMTQRVRLDRSVRNTTNGPVFRWWITTPKDNDMSIFTKDLRAMSDAAGGHDAQANMDADFEIREAH